jgi:hypothetical protein
VTVTYGTLEEARLTMKRDLTRWAGLLATSAIIFAACSSGGGAATSAPSASASSHHRKALRPSESASASASAGAVGGPSEELIGRRQAEGNLTTIALPHDWCNYGEVLDSFKTKYGSP